MDTMTIHSQEVVGFSFVMDNSSIELLQETATTEILGLQYTLPCVMDQSGGRTYNNIIFTVQ